MPFSFINTVASWMLKKRIHQIELFVKYPVDVQNDELNKLIQIAKNTEIGKKYDFSNTEVIILNDISSLSEKIIVELQRFLLNEGYIFVIMNNNIKEILNPYFTTKKEGTGLGLSIVNKIINDHNGNIEFISKADGAVIKIIFTK